MSSPAPEGQARRVVLDTATLLIAAVAVGFAITSSIDRSSEGRGTPEPRVDRFIENWRELAEEGHWLGPRDARWVLVEFGDYQCVWCRRVEPLLRSLREAFPDDVAIVYRHFTMPYHAHARPSALLAECAALQQRFEEVHELLYDAIDLGALDARRVSEAVELPDPAEFIRCVDHSEALDRIEADVAAARSVGIRGTPALIANGVLLAATPDSAALPEMVSRSLAEAEDSDRSRDEAR
jgi:hypothetical protein